MRVPHTKVAALGMPVLNQPELLSRGKKITNLCYLPRKQSAEDRVNPGTCNIIGPVSQTVI
jgi:hypothetical protein